MPKVKIGDIEVDYPDVRDANEGWEDIPENNNPWEDIPQTDDRSLIHKGWDLINKPLPEYLPDKERSLVRKGLGYNPIFDTALDYAGVSPERIRGLETAKENVGESLLTPLSLGTFGAGGVISKIPWLSRTLAGGFALASGKGAVESGIEAYNAKDPEEQTRALAETGANLTFGGLAGLHASRPGKGSVVEDIKNVGPRLLENAKGEGNLPPIQEPIVTPFNNELNTIYKQNQIGYPQSRFQLSEGRTFNQPDVPYEYNIKRPTQAEPKIIDVDSKVTPITDVKLGPAETPQTGELIRPFTKPSDTSNLRQLPIRYQEQFPKQSMYGVQGNLEKGSENVNPNPERLASEVGNRQQELEQAKSIENAGREAIETGRVVQAQRGEIIPAGKYTPLPRSSQALGITNPKAQEVADLLTKKYDELKEQMGDFVPTLMKEIATLKPFGITADKEGKVNPYSLQAKMLTRLSKPEQEMLKQTGFIKWLEWHGNAKVGLNEAMDYLKQNSPKVEVRKLEAFNASDINKESAKLQHKLDTLGYKVDENSGKWIAPDGKLYETFDLPNEVRNTVNRLDELASQLSGHTTPNESATARYTQVNPKPLDKMPGAVDLLVRLPQVEKPSATGATTYKEIPKFTSQHYPTEGKNLIAHVRGHMETLPDGKKVFHVFEVQSDWAQKVRDQQENADTDLAPGTKIAREKLNDPTLPYYEHLALKAAIKHAIDNGAAAIAISDANTAMLSEGHDTISGAVEKVLPNELLSKMRPEIGATENTLNRWFGNDWKNGKYVKFQDEFFRVDNPEKNNWDKIESTKTAKELQPYAEGGNYIPQQAGMRQHYDASLPNIAEKLTGSKPTKVDFGEHQNVREQGYYHREPVAAGTPAPLRDNLILKDENGNPQTSIKANLFNLDKIKPRVSELKEPFSTYSTLYAGIPLEAFGKAIAHTASDLWHSETARNAREFATNVLRDSIHTIGTVGGEAGRYLAPHLEGFFRSEREYYGKIVNDAMEKMRDAKLNAKEQNDLMRYAWEERYNKPHTTALNTKQTALLNDLRTNLKMVHDEQRKLGILVGGVRAAMDNPKYWPGIVATKVLDTITGKPESIETQSLKNDWVAHVIKESKGKVGIDEAKKLYNDYVNAISKFGKSSTDFAAIRKAEGYGVPWSWQEKSLPRLFNRYGRRVGRDFAYFTHLENDPVSRGILNIADQTGDFSKNATKLPGGSDINAISSMPQVKDLMRWVNQDFTKADINMESLGRVVKTGMLGALTSASNYFQNVGKVAPYLNPNQWGLYIKAHTQLSQGLRDAYKQGVARINPAEIANPTLGYNSFADRLNQFANASYRWQGGSKIENLTRGIDMSLGQLVTLSHMGEAFARGDKNATQVLDNLVKHAEVEDWRKFKNQMPNVPKEWLDKVAATFVERVQQTYDPRDQPMFALNSKLSPFLSLSRWSIGASNHIYRDVVEPMKQGNYMPALSYLTMSGVVGATVLPVLHQLLTGRKSHDPTIKEAVLSGNTKEMGIAFANALNLASFGGIVGDLTKGAIELSQGRSPRGFAFPVVDFLKTQLIERTRQASEAIKNGEPADIVMRDYVVKAMQDNVQSLRLVANHTWNAKDIEHSNKVRDYETFSRLNNEPQTEAPNSNPFTGSAEKDFKRSTDLNEIPDLAINAVNQIVNRNKEDPIRLASQLRGLKSMPITWMPSVEGNPMEFMKYVDFVEKTQGKEEAQKLVSDYATQKAVNQAKSQAVPNLRVR